MAICLDSHILIWGIKKQSSTGQEDMVARAEKYFEYLDENKEDIIVPSVVLAEILAPEDQQTQRRLLGTITSFIQIANFDSRVALKMAELMHGKMPEIKRIRNESAIRNDKMKFDYAIIATAVVYGASQICSYDPGLKKFAHGIIDVVEIPIIPEQAKLTFPEAAAEDLPF